MIAHVLHLQSGEHDATDHGQPPIRLWGQRKVTVAAGDQGRTRAVAHEPERVDEVAHEIALVGAAEVVVHPGEHHHGNGFLHPAKVAGDEETNRKDCKEEPPRLHYGNPARRQRTPRFVDGILDNRARQTLIGQVEDQDIDPVPKNDQGKSTENGQQLRCLIGCHDWPGEGAENPEGRLWNHDGLEVVAGRQPQGSKMVERGHGRLMAWLRLCSSALRPWRVQDGQATHLGFFIDELVGHDVLLLRLGQIRHVGETGGLFGRVDDGQRVHVGLGGRDLACGGAREQRQGRRVEVMSPGK